MSDDRPELPIFEVGQVTGDLLPGRRRHDWCSVHGDIGPAESIDAHARRLHGASAEAIRAAHYTLALVEKAALAESRPTADALQAALRAVREAEDALIAAIAALDGKTT